MSATDIPAVLSSPRHMRKPVLPPKHLLAWGSHDPIVSKSLLGCCHSNSRLAANRGHTLTMILERSDTAGVTSPLTCLATQFLG